MSPSYYLIKQCDQAHGTANVQTLKIKCYYGPLIKLDFFIVINVEFINVFDQLDGHLSLFLIWVEFSPIMT